MKLNEYILQVLGCFGAAKIAGINKQLFKIDSGYRFFLDEKNFIEIGDNFLNVNGINIEDKIKIANSRKLNVIDIDKVNSFISKIARDIREINHLGISYSCRIINEELIYYKRLLLGTGLGIFEEKSTNIHNRWFFIGSTKERQSPLFEIILTESPTPICDGWLPHFHIDFNTELDYESLVRATKMLGVPNFAEWKLDIPDCGVVLLMGFLGNIEGTKIMFGMGTDLRRNPLLREIP